MRRSISFAPLALAVVTSLAACRGGDAAPERRTLIDSRDRYDPRSLDPALSTDVPTGRAVGYLFEGLTRFTPEAELEPALAERWEVSPDGMTYTFHLRRGVVFHDGTPFVARHVERSFRRVLDPAVRGGRGWPLYPVRGAQVFAEGKAPSIAGIRTPDDSTVVITLSAPQASFPKMLAMPVASIVPDSVPSNFGERPVGTGPWKFAEWRHDDYLLFARNERHWGDVPAAESLMARIIPEPSTAVAEFESGRVDLLIVPEAETRSWEQTDEKQAMLQSAPALILYYIAINTTRGPLADVRVRQALNHAIDARTMLAQLLGGRGRLASGVVAPSLQGADTARAQYAFDAARAKQLLSEAGHPNGIDIELWHSQDETISRLAQAAQGYLGEGGFRVKLVQREASSVREASRNGEADLVLKTWYADYPDAEAFLFPLLHSSNTGVGGNVEFYRSPRFDAIVDSARRELNDPRRAELYRRADSLAFVEAPHVNLFHYNELLAVQPWIRDFRVPVIFNGQRWTDVRIEAMGGAP